MGRRGPHPTPTKVLKMRGSWLASRRSNEPKPEMGIPTCPEILKGRARNIWFKLTKKIDYMGILAKIDQDALTMYCQLFSQWIEVQEFLAEHSLIYPVKKIIKEENGTSREVTIGFKMFPQVRIASDLVSHLLRIGDRFGFTPAARAQLNIYLSQNDENNPEATEKFFKLG